MATKEQVRQVQNALAAEARRLAEKEGIPFDQALMRLNGKYPNMQRVWLQNAQGEEDASKS